MATVFEDLTSQIDGIADTFTTLNDTSIGFIPDLNGQVVSQNDVTVLTAFSFRLGFVPAVGDTLAIFITPDIFNITTQIDGTTSVFVKDVTDLGLGDFIAILNGQILVNTTTTINDTSFRLASVPLVGDTLEYIRAVRLTCDKTDQSAIGIIQNTNLIGIVSDSGNIKGFVPATKRIKGVVREIKITGEVKESDKLFGIVNEE